MARLGILCCTKSKIWDQNPEAGPTPAKEAYRGTKFINDRDVVLDNCDRWVILSAKYGFMDPDFVVPRRYDVTFSMPWSEGNPYIGVSDLVDQIRRMGLDSFPTIRLFASCGKEYEKRIREAFNLFGPSFE